MEFENVNDRAVARRKTIFLKSIVAAVGLCLLTLTSVTVLSASNNDVLERFPAPQENFQQHIKDVREYLLDTQLEERKPSDVNYNLPFEILANDQVPYRGKYLLIHGLNDSPDVWRDAAKSLVARGFDVRAILLPGHGNTPEAQLNVSYSQWLEVARAQLSLWRTPDIPLYIGGFSLGGVIATILAVENDDIDGLLLFAPAYYSTKNSLLRWASITSYFKPWVFGSMILEDNPTKYNSIPINAAAQYFETTKYLRKIWGDNTLDIPVLMIASFDDSVVDAEGLRRIFSKRFTSSKKRLVLYGTGEEQPNLHEIIRPSEYLFHRILNQSHLSMIRSPDNALFGVNGTQLVCNGNDWKVFSACLYYEGGKRWHGAEGTNSPDDVPMARTTFNPDFYALMELHDEVFATYQKRQ